MNGKNLKLCEDLITRSYLLQAEQARNQRENLITTLVSQRLIPQTPWDELSIQLILQQICLMDSNTFLENVGIGEREGRIFGGFNSLVSRRNFGMSHGIGRSGDIAALQPKAAGSSLLSKLTQSFVRHAIQLSGARCVQKAIIVPVSTGMAITIALLTIKSKRPNAKYVIWPRIDQKTCFKCILTSGLIPIIVENVLEYDQLTTDMEAIQKILNETEPEEIACIFSTTSCFAPRTPDKIIEISQLCKDFNIPHIVNNAYGLQLSKCMHMIDHSSRKGRLDYFIQSTDKNFLVPVGGAVVASSSKQLITDYCEMYPGRASSSPLIDVFIQLLSMGVSGYLELLSDRKEMFTYLKEKIAETATKFGERILITPLNQISIGMTLDSFEKPTMLGSMLFTRCCSGERIVAKLEKKNIGKYEFVGYGAHCSNYPHNYLTVAAGIGINRREIDIFIKRLEDSILDYRKKYPLPPSSVIS